MDNVRKIGQWILMTLSLPLVAVAVVIDIGVALAVAGKKLLLKKKYTRVTAPSIEENSED